VIAIRKTIYIDNRVLQIKKMQYHIVNFQAIKFSSQCGILELLPKCKALYAQILDAPSSKEGVAFVWNYCKLWEQL
jgi:hypothetical protein